MVLNIALDKSCSQINIFLYFFKKTHGLLWYVLKVPIWVPQPVSVGKQENDQYSSDENNASSRAIPSDIWAAPCKNMSSGHVRTAKAQIRLCICAVWSGPSLSSNRITVDSRYLQFQGTHWNTSRYPYLDISELKEWGKQWIEQPHLTNKCVIWLLKLEIYV